MAHLTKEGHMIEQWDDPRREIVIARICRKAREWGIAYSDLARLLSGLPSNRLCMLDHADDQEGFEEFLKMPDMPDESLEQAAWTLMTVKAAGECRGCLCFRCYHVF